MLIRHTLLYLPAQIIGPITQFLAILVFTHWMAPAPYGLFTYILASQDFVFFLCLSWWSQYTVRYFSGAVTGADERYRQSEFAILLGSAVAQVAATLLVLRLVTETIAPALAAATILYMLTRSLALHLGERARAQGHILDYTLAVSAGPLAGFALAFAGVAFIAATPTVALAGYGIAQAIALVWLMARQDVRYVPRRPDPALLRQALAFGIPLIAAGVAAWVSLNAIRILVDHRLGAAAMGLVAVGWSLGQRLTATASMLVTVAAFPLAVASFREGSREEALRQLATNGLLMFGILLPAAAGLYLLQGPLVTLLIAPPFRAMTLAVLPAALAAGLFRNIRTHVGDQVFMLIERTPMVCLMTVVEMVAVLVGCGAGMAADGAAGAALGSAAGFGVAMVAEFVVARLGAGLRLPLLGVALVTAAVAVMAGAIALVAPATPGSPVGRIAIVVAAGGMAYLCAILALFPDLTRGAWARLRQTAAR